MCRQFVETFITQFCLGSCKQLAGPMLELLASLLAEPDVELRLPEQLSKEQKDVLLGTSVSFKIELARGLLKNSQTGEEQGSCRAVIEALLAAAGESCWLQRRQAGHGSRAKL